MKLIDHSCASIEEDLALDELMLARAESGDRGETLRFWSREEYSVVLGRAGRTAVDCDTGACERDGVRILRRISGGGTVLQGPGCLNYSAVLSYSRDKDMRDINGSYRGILGRVAEAFAGRGLGVEFFPVCDLALDGKKISGNAQARKKDHFLHHGTFLVDLDIEKVSLYLKHPGAEPAYRKGRRHKDFLANIPLSRDDIMELVMEVFEPSGTIPGLASGELEELGRLAREKYSLKDWNFAF